MPGLKSMSKFWIWQSSAYGRVFNMRALHSILDISEVLNMPGFWIWLHKVLNMPQYGWIYLNKTWICLNMSEFTIINRFLNMVTVRVNGYLLTDRCMQNPIYYLRWSALEKLCKKLNLKSWEGYEYVSDFKYVRVLNIRKFPLIWQRSEYALGCNYGKVLIVQGFWVC